MKLLQEKDNWQTFCYNLSFMCMCHRIVWSQFVVLAIISLLNAVILVLLWCVVAEKDSTPPTDVFFFFTNSSLVLSLILSFKNLGFWNPPQPQKSNNLPLGSLWTQAVIGFLKILKYVCPRRLSLWWMWILSRTAQHQPNGSIRLTVWYVVLCIINKFCCVIINN